MSPAALKALMDGDIENALIASLPGGIEAQEALGQQRMVESCQLPKKGDWDKLREIGIEVCGDADDLFFNVNLPEGWKLQATDHSMWSSLLDDKGRRRASIFYKAAFYDRRAHISLDRRFGISGYVSCDSDGNPVDYGQETHFGTFILDCDDRVKCIGLRDKDDHRDSHYNAAQSYLNSTYPNWNDPMAYWD